MKKHLSIIALILVISMFTLTGCSLFGGGEKTTTTTPTTPTTSEKPTQTTPTTSTTEKPAPELDPITVYLVGDSTGAAFEDQYYLPRYGYGTQLANYLSDKATVVNLALSGRSSKSFLAEANYTRLKNELKAGDVLIIGFGHNDEKSDDTARFTDASKPYTEEGSFGYHLNTYYIQLAFEKGAIPILCTPIVRAASDNNYNDSEGHVTATGDYAQAIRDLGEALGVDVIDLTQITKDRYVEIGFDEACKYHAVLSAQYDTDGTTVVPNWKSVDKTHLNIYGAKFVAYSLVQQFLNIEKLAGYVNDVAAPTEADLVPNPNYVVPDYMAPDLESYVAPSHFATTSEGWYGTAFGNTGGSPSEASNGYVAKETSEGVFEVGQFKDGSNKGKFENASDGFAFLFRQVGKNDNFKMTVSGKILKSAMTKQAGFGVMLRDDATVTQVSNGTINTNYVTAGMLANSGTEMALNFYRENGKLAKGSQTAALLGVGDTFTCTIERVGQSVTVTVTCGGETYTDTHVDFDFFAVDNEYMYVGMFANRGTVVEFYDLTFTITGESQGA